MSSVIKKLNLYDKLFISSNSFMHLAMHLSDPSKTGTMIDKIHKLMIGSRSKVDGDNLISVANDPVVVKIPDNISTLHESINYMIDNHIPNTSNRLVCIGASKNTIVINANHMVSDGGFLKDLFETLRDDKEFKVPHDMKTTLDLFEEDCDKVFDIPIDHSFNPNLTRLFPKDAEMTRYRGCVSTSIASADVSSYKCYDIKSSKPRMFSDALYASVIFAISAYTNDFSRQGIKTVLDMRNYLNSTKNRFELGDLYSNLAITAHVNVDSNVFDLMKQTRASYESQIKNKMQFGFLKKIFHPEISSNPASAKPIPGAIVGVSNVGVFKLGGIIDDVAIDVSYDAGKSFDPFFVTQYSVLDTTNKKNRSTILGKHKLNTFSEREAALLTQSILFGLKNIDINSSCGEALDKMKDFQNKFIKEEYPKYIMSLSKH